MEGASLTSPCSSLLPLPLLSPLLPPPDRLLAEVPDPVSLPGRPELLLLLPPPLLSSPPLLPALWWRGASSRASLSADEREETSSPSSSLASCCLLLLLLLPSGGLGGWGRLYRGWLQE